MTENSGSRIEIVVYSLMGLYGLQTLVSIVGNAWVLCILFRQFLLDLFPKLAIIRNPTSTLNRKLSNAAAAVLTNNNSNRNDPEMGGIKLKNNENSSIFNHSNITNNNNDSEKSPTIYSPAPTPVPSSSNNYHHSSTTAVISPGAKYNRCGANYKQQQAEQLGVGRNNKSKRFKAGFLHLVALSLTDIFSAVSLPYLIHHIGPSDYGWTLNRCRFFYVTLGVHRLLSPFLLVALAVDRYFAVCQSGHPNYRRHRYAACILVVCTTFSGLLMTPQIIYATLEVPPGQNESSCLIRYPSIDFSQAIFMAQFILAYVLPLMLIVFCYGSSLTKLWKHTSRFNSHIPLKKIVLSSASLITFHFVCWSPYWISSLVYCFPRIFIYSLSSSLSPTDLTNQTTSSDQSTNSSLPLMTTKEADGIIWSFIPNNYSFYHDLNESLVVHIILLLSYLQPAVNWILYVYMNKQLRSSPDRLGSLPNYVLAKIYRELNHKSSSASATQPRRRKPQLVITQDDVSVVSGEGFKRPRSASAQILLNDTISNNSSKNSLLMGQLSGHKTGRPKSSYLNLLPDHSPSTEEEDCLSGRETEENEDTEVSDFLVVPVLTHPHYNRNRRCSAPFPLMNTATGKNHRMMLATKRRINVR